MVVRRGGAEASGASACGGALQTAVAVLGAGSSAAAQARASAHAGASAGAGVVAAVQRVLGGARDAVACTLTRVCVCVSDCLGRI